MTDEKRKRKNAEYVRKHYAKNKDKPEYKAKALARRLSKYGLSVEDYMNLQRAQNFTCALCSTEDPGGVGDFHVDHCHETGVVRGLLCYHCNTGLGKFKDNPEVLRRAATYIEANSRALSPPA
jgi:hypothetical protein